MDDQSTLPPESSRKKKPVVRLDARQWAKMRLRWQSGGVTFQQLADEHGVSVDLIKHRSMDCQWRKQIPEIRARIEELETRKTEEMFAKLGMPKEEAIRLIIEGMREPQKTLFEGKGDQMMATPQPDWFARVAFIQEYNKIVGNYAPTKQENKTIEKLEFNIVKSRAPQPVPAEPNDA